MKSIRATLPSLFLVFSLSTCENSRDQNEGWVENLESATLYSDLIEREHQGRVVLYKPNTNIPFSGWVKMVYPNNNPEHLCLYENGIEDGPFAWWHKSGQMWERGTMIDGEIHGNNLTWHTNGQLLKDCNYTMGQPTGVWNQWYPSGAKASQSKYHDGKVLTRLIWKPDGSKCPKTSVVNGSGPYVFYDSSGRKVEEGSYEDGSLEGQFIMWRPDGVYMVGVYRQGVKNGPYVAYWPEGNKLEEGFYKNGERNGKYIIYHKSGKIAQTGKHEDGVRNGPYIDYYESGGKAEESIYFDGEKHGEFTAYHENGQVSEKGSYIYGKQSGRFQMWYPSGKKKAEGAFSNGVGRGIMWNEDGNIISHTK